MDHLSVMQQLSATATAWRRYRQQRLAPLEITIPQLRALQQLARHPFLYPSQIAERLGCDRPTVTVILRNMRREGWIARQRDEDDRRQVRVAITARGLHKLDQVAPESPRDATPSPDPLGCFDEREVAELARLLSRLNEHLAGLAAETPR